MATLRWMTRRGVLSGAAAATVLSASGLAACSRRSAAPAPAQTTTVLTFGPGTGEARWSATLAQLVQIGISPFVQQHRGLDIRVVPSPGGPGLVLEVLGGKAPDVSAQGQLGVLTAGDALLNLTKYAHRQNVDFSIWNGVAEHWSTPTGLWGLPGDTNMYGMVVNLGHLDRLGLAYPPKDWTYQDAATIWRKATVLGGHSPIRGGALLKQSGMQVPSSLYLHGWGAAYVDAADRTRCTLDSAQAVACGEWFYGLIRDKVVIPTTNAAPVHFHSKHVAMGMFGTSAIAEIPTMLSGFKWDFWPLPAGPKGLYTQAGPDGMVIAADTKHPDLAWEFLYWLAAQPQYQRWRMKAMLLAPVLNALMPEYVHTLQQVAPVYRKKDMGVFTRSARGLVVRNDFTYLAPETVNILNHWGSAILAGKAPVSTAFRQAALQINAFEAVAGTGAGGLNTRMNTIRREIARAARSAAATTFPPPARTGAGVAPTPLAPAALAEAGSVYTLTGSGVGVARWTIDDGMAFACVPWTGSRGTFTCRLDAMSAVSGAPVRKAEIGLMARGDLSSSAPLAALSVVVKRGLIYWTRPVPLVRQQFQGPLIPAKTLLVPSTQKAPNYLHKPLWLRLVQDVNRWTAYSSPDGKKWTRQGKTEGLEMTSCWVGILASTYYGAGAATKGVFSHLSFTPTERVQIGSAG